MSNAIVFHKPHKYTLMEPLVSETFWLMRRFLLRILLTCAVTELFIFQTTKGLPISFLCSCLSRNRDSHKIAAEMHNIFVKEHGFHREHPRNDVSVDKFTFVTRLCISTLYQYVYSGWRKGHLQDQLGPCTSFPALQMRKSATV